MTEGDKEERIRRREAIAAQVLGYVCMSNDFAAEPEELAKRAVDLADALIAHLAEDVDV